MNRRWWQRLLGELLLVGIVFGCTAWVSYYGVTHLHQVVPPGDDIYPHLEGIIKVVANGPVAYGTGYPQGFYVLVVALAKAFSVNPLVALNYLAPLLLPLVGLSIYLFGRVIFNHRAGLIALIMLSFVSLQPLQTYYDGSLPGIIGVGVLMPIAFILLIKTFSVETLKQKLVFGGAWLLASGLVFYTHHLSSLIYVVVLGVTLPVTVVILFLTRERRRYLVYAIPGMLGIIGLIALLVWNLEVFAPQRSLFNYYVDFRASQFPYFFSKVIEEKHTWTVLEYGTSLSALVFEFAILAAAFAVGLFYKLSRKERIGLVILVAWASIYLLGSMVTWSGEPSRLARDFAVPACILVAWVVDRLLNVSAEHSPAAGVVLVVALLLSAQPTLQKKLEIYFSYSPMVRFSTADEEAYRYLLDNNLGADTAIASKDPSWERVIKVRGDEERLPHLLNDKAGVALDSSRCFLAGWYFKDVWPPNFEDKAIYNQLNGKRRFDRIKSFHDPIKTLHLFCRR